MKTYQWIRVGVAWAGLAAVAATAAERVDRDLGVMMLRRAKRAVATEYFDPALRGFPLEQRCAEAEAAIAKAESNVDVFRLIGQVFLDLGDPQTYWVPPPRKVQVDYGWAAMTVGDACFVRWVDARSDAAKKGVKRGDRIEAVNGIAVNRATWPKLAYSFYVLSPQRGLRVTLRPPGGEARELDLMAEVKEKPEEAAMAGGEARDFGSQGAGERDGREPPAASVFAEVGDTLVWRLRGFSRQGSPMREDAARLRRAKAVVLDLRGSGGRSQAALEELVGNLFDREVTVATVQERGEKKPITVKPAAAPFAGLLVVLVDAGTASFAELFARMIQLEDRGIVIGDRTSGRAQIAKTFTEKVRVGVEPARVSAISVTVGGFVLRDGKALDSAGVMPDLPVRPTGGDLAANRDPALALALAQTGHKLTPEAAAKVLAAH
jgi:C-terminal processing protease CtpA/Prc